MTSPAIDEALDLDRYPIAALDGEAAQALLAEGRAALAARGSFVLPGLLRPEAVARVLEEHRPQFGEAYYCEKSHTVALAPQDTALPPEHPANRLQVSDLGCLAWDQIGANSLLGRLYEWRHLRDFLAALLGYPKLFPYEDPLGSVNLNLFQPGQQLGWHYDNADFAVTLMLQPAKAGGVYEYLPAFRDRPDPDGERLGDGFGGCARGCARAGSGAGRTSAVPRPPLLAPGDAGRRRRTPHPGGVQLRHRARPTAHRPHPAPLLRPRRLTRRRGLGLKRLFSARPPPRIVRSKRSSSATTRPLMLSGG